MASAFDLRMQPTSQHHGSATNAPVPGKRSLTEALPMQRHVAGAAPAPVEGQQPTGARPSLNTLFGGASLPAATRAHMERSFATSFSSVRIHEGPEAAAVGAAAYTQGEHIAFAPGRFDPGSVAGRALIGHELAHVVQQRSGRVATPQAKAEGAAINTDSSLEREADDAGARAARGLPVALGGGGGSGSSGDGPIQRQLEHRPFGDYWVGDAQPAEQLDAKVERISSEAFGELAQLWTNIQGGNAGNLQITEQDGDGKQHPGFLGMVTGALARLLSRSHGRGLLRGLANGGKRVRIRPLSSGHENHAIQDGDLDHGMRPNDQNAGTPCDAFVEIDPAMTDDRTSAFDADYNKLDNPMFIVIGHELIHARHMTLGIAAQRDTAPRTSPKYHELEEEETIAAGNPLDHDGPTENKLRDEHDLPARFGHDGMGPGHDHQVSLSPQKRTLGDIAALGGVTLQRLFADNPRLAPDLLDADPGLARGLLESGSHDAYRDELTNRPDDELVDQRTDRETFTRVIGPVLRADHALAVQALIPDGVAMGDYCGDNPWVMDEILRIQGLADQIGPRFGEPGRVVLAAMPVLLNALLAHEDCMNEIYKRDETCDELSQDPRIKLGLSLHNVRADAVMERTAKTASEALLAGPTVGAIECDTRTFQLAGCTSHHVRRVQGHAQTLEQIGQELTMRGDRSLLEQLNPKVNLDALQVGDLLAVPTIV